MIIVKYWNRALFCFGNQDHRHNNLGPSAFYRSGYQTWHINGKLNRKNGPARIWPNGNKEWFLNGKRHRTNGPAVITGRVHRYYLNGAELTRTDFLKQRDKK